MRMKVLKNERDYDAALARMEELWHAEPETHEGDEAELWTMLIENYEAAMNPIDLPDPIEAIKFRMDQEGLKAKDLVPYFGSAAKVSDVLNGRRGLSLTMIRALHAGMGISLEVLTQEAKEEEESSTGMEWDRFPVQEMVSRQWFSGFKGGVTKARKQVRELMLGMVQGQTAYMMQPALLRQKTRAGGKLDDYALLAWQLRVHALCAEIEGEMPEYAQGTITEDFIRSLSGLSSFKAGPQLVRDKLNQHGIYLILESHLPKTHLDGAAMWHKGRPVVALTLRHDRVDNFWFTLGHELSHLALHLTEDCKEAYLDDLSSAGESDAELEADALAADCLIAGAAWESWFQQRVPRKNEVISFASECGIHPAVVAGRVRRELNNYKVLWPLVKFPVRESFHQRGHQRSKGSGIVKGVRICI